MISFLIYLIEACCNINGRGTVFHDVVTGTNPIKLGRFPYALNRLQFSQIQPFVDSWSEPLVIFANRQSFMVGLRQVLLHAKNITFPLNVVLSHSRLLIRNRRYPVKHHSNFLTSKRKVFDFKYSRFIPCI